MSLRQSKMLKFILQCQSLNKSDTITQMSVKICYILSADFSQSSDCQLTGLFFKEMISYCHIIAVTLLKKNFSFSYGSFATSIHVLSI